MSHLGSKWYWQGGLCFSVDATRGFWLPAEQHGVGGMRAWGVFLGGERVEQGRGRCNRGFLCLILSPVLGSKVPHGASWFCTSELVGHWACWGFTWGWMPVYSEETSSLLNFNIGCSSGSLAPLLLCWIGLGRECSKWLLMCTFLQSVYFNLDGRKKMLWEPNHSSVFLVHRG